MSTNGVNATEDAELTDCEGEQVVTMMDVLQEQKDFEEDANAVLGASDDKNCTYSKGYIKRQAIYACLTCCSEAKEEPSKRAGVCLACSLTCHENHELVELYTKRNFRCDCGNPKFSTNPCHYTPNKTELNDENIYNQNFSGLYCVCHRPYPDPEATFEDEMIQCIVCEDWLHSSHLDATVPGIDQYSEMVCKACMEKNEFLHDYTDLMVNVELVDVDITTINDSVTSAANATFNSTLDQESTEKENKYENTAENTTELNGLKETTEKPIFNESSDGNIANTDVDMEDEKPTEGTQVHPKELETDGIDKVIKDNMDNNKEKTEESIEISKKTTEQTDSLDSETNSQDPVSSPNTVKVSDTKIDNLDTSNENETEMDNTELELSVKECSSENKQEELDLVKDKPIDENNEIEAVNDSEKKILEYKLPESSSEEKEKELENKQDKLCDENVQIDPVISDSTKESEKNIKSNADEVIDEISSTETPISTEEILKPDNDVTSEASAANNLESENKTEVETLCSIDTGKSETAEASSDAEPALIASDKTDNNVENFAEINKENVKSEEAKLENQDQEMVENSNEYIPKTDTENSSVTENNDVEMSEKIKENHQATEKPIIEDETLEKPSEHKRKLSTEDSDDTVSNNKKAKIEKICVRPRGVKKIHKGATFWPSYFRQRLCTCNVCIEMYKDLSVLFLIDPEDTVTAYENLGMEKINGNEKSQYEKGLEALSSLDRVQQINALTEYNKMRDKLLDFLKSFKDRKEIVKEDDIKAFFAGMKPKREPDGVYFCR